MSVISAETLGVPRAKKDRRDAQDLQLYVHASVSDNQRARNHTQSKGNTLEQKQELRSEKCDWRNRRRKLWETGGVRGTIATVDITA